MLYRKKPRALGGAVRNARVCDANELPFSDRPDTANLTIEGQVIWTKGKQLNRKYRPAERLGINAIERMVLRLGWIFREQPIADVGIDALIEICEQGKPSGRLIALQIKSGDSYFKESSAEGFVYRGSNAHLDYWSGHSLPVFLVLYHPGRDEAWWCAVTSEAVEQTPRGWRVTVPSGQRLEESSRSAMAAFAVPDFARRRQVAARASLIGSPDLQTRLSSLLDALASAQREIDVASPFLDDRLFWALSAISHGSVHVRLVTAPYPQTVRDETYSRDHVNVAWRTARNLHSKSIVIDRTLAIYGSANFTAPSWRQCNEQIVVSTATEMVTAICKSFDEIWNASIDVDDNTAAHSNGR
jgi:hypothetical protein